MRYYLIIISLFWDMILVRTVLQICGVNTIGTFSTVLRVTHLILVMFLMMLVCVLDLMKCCMLLKNCHWTKHVDQITAEHLRHASNRLSVFLVCFSGWLMHGVLPDSMLTVLFVPLIKNKTVKISSIDNYRPIALASILSKVLERILLDWLQDHILTTDRQFGFKSKHSTDLFNSIQFSLFV